MSYPFGDYDQLKNQAQKERYGGSVKLLLDHDSEYVIPIDILT